MLSSRRGTLSIPETSGWFRLAPVRLRFPRIPQTFFLGKLFQYILEVGPRFLRDPLKLPQELPRHCPFHFVEKFLAINFPGRRRKLPPSVACFAVALVFIFIYISGKYFPFWLLSWMILIIILAFFLFFSPQFFQHII